MGLATAILMHFLELLLQSCGKEKRHGLGEGHPNSLSFVFSDDVLSEDIEIWAVPETSGFIFFSFCCNLVARI